MEMDDNNFSGTVIGHVIPGSFFVGFGLFFLILATRRLSKADSVGEFCETHVPEKDLGLMKRIGILVIVCTVIGILVEGIGGMFTWGRFFSNMQHITLYTLFLFSGIVGLMEAVQWLPPDSFRAGVAFALFSEALIWHEHSLMKMNFVDQQIHALASISCLGSGVCMAFSIVRPNNLAAYIASFLFMLWHGLWLNAAAVNIAAEVHWNDEHMVSYFILEGVFLGCITAVVGACIYRKHAKGDDYQPVQFKNIDDDEGDDVLEESADFVNGVGATNGNAERPYLHVV